MMAVSNNTNI